MPKSETLLFNLLHRRSDRAYFLAQLKKGQEFEAPDFTTIDAEQLQASVRLISERLLKGNHQGGKGLLAIFPETFAIWELESGENAQELVERFQESVEFESYREYPFAGEGLCVEQAFYEFVTRNVWRAGDPLEGIVRNEFLMGLYRSLANNPDPNFTTDPKWVKVGRHAAYTVQIYDYRLVGKELKRSPHWVLYSARDRVLSCGEVTGVIADLLYFDDPIPHLGELARRHRVDVLSLTATLNEIRKLGVG